MKIIECILISIVVFLAISTTYLVVNASGKYTWVCHVKGVECSTYGLGFSKKHALRMGYGLCQKECGNCKIDYCEKIKK